MTDRAKNLLIIMSDEHRRDAMGCAGHPIVKTPHLDRLAERGTIFTNAYTPSPMCVPARAAVACGQPVHRIGYWDSATAYDGRHRSWMHDLRDAGVEVTSFGKLHFRSDSDDTGFCRQVLPMHVVDGVGWPIGLLRKDPPRFDGAAELAADIGPGESSYSTYDRAITAAAETWLRARTDGDGPWVSFVSLVCPHYPLRAPDAFYALYDPEDMDTPVAPAKPPDHPELEAVRAFFCYHDHFDDETTRRAKAAYYGLISFMDDCVGRVLRALEESGQAEDTAVIYVSDHGDMMGDQGIWTKQVMYDASAGVPMIAAGPGFPRGRRVGTGTSLLDLAAMARDIAGCGETGAGPSLSAVAQAPDDPERTVFSEYHDGGSTTGTFMVRWQDWKYVHYVGMRPQLFDLAQDPHELDDLAVSRPDAPEVQAAIAEGLRRLRTYCDPEAVNAQCFADQARRIEELGGAEACRNAFVFNHTPTPTG